MEHEPIGLPNLTYEGFLFYLMWDSNPQAFKPKSNAVNHYANEIFY